MKWSSKTVEQVLSGKWSRGARDFRATNVQAFPRKCKGGTLFVAFSDETFRKYLGYTNYVYYGSGKSYDYHGKVKSLVEKGLIACAIVEKEVEGLPEGFPQFIVSDTFKALEGLAAYSRSLTKATCVAITGTVGKSSTKKMIMHLLRGDSRFKTPKMNNRQHVAVGLANFSHNLNYWIFEVAQSALWTEDDGIAPVLEPDVSIITNIGLGQIQRVKSEFETAEIKSKIAKWVKPGGHVIYNKDMLHSDYVERVGRASGASLISYGSSKDSDIFISKFSSEGGKLFLEVDGVCGRLSYTLQARSQADAENSLAAIATLYSQGVVGDKLLQALDKFSSYTPAKSSEVFYNYSLNNEDVVLIDGSYSAQVPAIKSALEIAKDDKIPGDLVLVLGRIIGMEEKAESVHRSLKEPVLDSGVSKVYTIGNEMLYLRDELPESVLRGHFDSPKECAEAVFDELDLPAKILVKGSARGTDLRNFPAYFDSLLSSKDAVLVSGKRPAIKK